MKQSNHAIKFLLAQYRAIFKHANIAMAIALASAALASAQAQAAAQDLSLSQDPTAPTDSASVSGDVTWSGITPGYVNELIITNDGTLAFDGSTTKNKGHIRVGDSLTIQSGGSLVLKGQTGSAADFAGWGLFGTLDPAESFASANSTLSVSGGSIEIDKSQLQMTNINLHNASVTIGGNMLDRAASDFSDNALINAEDGGVGGKGTFSLTGDLSLVTMNPGSTITARTLNLDGGNILMNGVSGDGTYAVIRAYNDAGAINVNGAAFNATGTGNVIGGAALNLNSGSMSIGNGGVVTLSGQLDKAGNLVDGMAAPAITMKDFTISGEGKLVIGKDGSGGTVSITGNTSITSDLENLSALTVASSGVLTINRESVKNDVGLFKKVNNTQGSVTIENGGTLNIANTTADSSFDLRGGLAFSDSAAANTIAVDDLAIIAGDFLSVTGGFNAQGKVSVKAHDTLTIGRPDFDSTNYSIGVADFRAKNVKFVPNETSNDFTLYEKLYLSSNGEATVGGSDLKVSDNITIDSGHYTFEKALTNQHGTVSVSDASLTMRGKLSVEQPNYAITANNATVDASTGGIALSQEGSIVLDKGSTLVLKAADVFTKDDAADTLSLTTSAYASGAVTAKDNSVIEFKDATGNKIALSEAQYDALLLGTKFTGLFAGLDVDVQAEQEMSLGEIKQGLTDEYDDTVVVDVTADGVKNSSIDVGSIKLADGVSELKLDTGGNLNLVNANATKGNGNFVSTKDAQGSWVAADVSLADANGNNLTLGGSGNIGAIKTKTQGKGSVTFGEDNNVGTVHTGALGEDALELASVIVDGSDVLVGSGDVYAHNVDIYDGSLSLEAGHKIVLGDGKTYNATNGTGISSTINGNLSAESLTVKTSTTGSLDLSNNAVVDLDSFSITSDVTINVGKDGVDNGAATLIADTMLFTDGTIIVDPNYGGPSSILAVNKITTDASKPDVQTIGGKVYVGKNSAAGIGVTEAKLKELIADYHTDAGGFNADGSVKNALVLNTPVTIADGAGIVINSEATRDQLNASFEANKVFMGGKSALIVTDEAFGADKSQAAVSFGHASSGAFLVGSESKIVLMGDFDANDTALKLAVKKTTGGTTVADGLADVQLEYAGGLLLGKPNADGTYRMEFQDSKAAQVYTGISRPVGDAIVAKLKGQFKNKQAAGYDLLSTLIAEENYKAVDAAAHAATYAGAQVAAVSSVVSMAEAVGGRIGSIGFDSAVITATGSQSKGGVWLSPMYKSVDADGFDAQGARYGADVDLSGVAFGADTVNGNMRFGAVFNLGSGDADGKGNGAGLKDEFDYYGFGIYSVMGFGQLALVGDASMTVINHDVEGLGLSGEADTTAVTMGVTGQYTFATPVVDVTPHLGARFIRLDTDSYDLMSAAGVEGNTDFDVQNVFSTPLGVTLSKAFTTLGGWSLAPSADLCLTFNTGDTDAKSTTMIAGERIGLNTEVLDEVQYGITLGLGAQKGAFGTSFGVNYTGSSNTDSFGVNAQARYVF